MNKVILICGKICSGKSYYANQLKSKENAVILGTDEVTYDLFKNNLGDKHDKMGIRINRYLMKKAVEIVKAGCSVILDWGFWRSKQRKEVTEYFNANNINVEWHYIDVDDNTYQKNIEERNRKVLNGEGGSDFFVDEGLLNKVLAQFEKPDKNEIDIWYNNERK